MVDAHKISIRELLKKRAITGFGHDISDQWIDEILENDCDRVALITTLNFSTMIRPNERMKKSVLLERYYVSALIDLSNPFIGTAVNLMLIILEKAPCESVLIGNYNDAVYVGHSYRMGLSKGEVSLPDFFPSLYNDYCNKIEQWYLNDTQPSNDGKYIFNYIPPIMLQNDKLAPRFYSTKILSIQEMLKHEQTVLLSDLAIIKKPRPITGEKALVITAKNFVYPFSNDNLTESWKTDTALEKHDIIIKNGLADRIYLLNEEPTSELYAGANDIVIRLKQKEMSAYIYFYMSSDTGSEVMRSMSNGTVLPRLSLRDVSKYPIILPSERLDYYLEQFKLKNYSVSDIQEYYSVLTKESIPQKPKRIEDILNAELVDKARLYKSEKLYSFLTSDFQEVNSCYRSKAYKSVLIMCGSILEAVLIDWLSELDSTDYFIEQFLITGHDGILRQADLSGYINALRDRKRIERPNWAKEADYSHKIRKNRNLVHAKLCIDDENINEARCNEVIDYLKAVLKTRGFLI